jgi:hypothetical protein
MSTILWCLIPKREERGKRGYKGEPRKTNRLDFLIKLLSESLHLEELMMQKTIPKSTLILAQMYISLYLQFLKEVCPRESGMGWKLTKFIILRTTFLHTSGYFQYSRFIGTRSFVAPT